MKNELLRIREAQEHFPKVMLSSDTIDDSFAHQIEIDSNIPVLSFVDPFGYKGLTMALINTLIKNNGSDCIFFFNYNRINMALSSNTKFDEYLTGIFGPNRAISLKQQLSHQTSKNREPLIINALIDALKENGGNYILPFKFYSAEMLRTSHFIVFVTKHTTGCRIMKKIMHANSYKDKDGVASFELKDSNNFSTECEQLSMFDSPFDMLCKDIYTMNRGTASVRDLCSSIETDITNHFISRNVKDALCCLEELKKLEVVSGRKIKYRSGKLTMPDNAIVRFIH